jgi:hypothetical protein
MTNYFLKMEPSKAKYDLDVRVNEGRYAYHTVLHNHTFAVWIVQQGYRRNVPIQEQSEN